MPLGSQESADRVPQAVQRLEVDGRDVTITLEELAREMRVQIEEDDRAGTNDVLAALATRLLNSRTERGEQTG